MKKKRVHSQRERRLAKALREITKLDCSYGLWPREAAIEIARNALKNKVSFFNKSYGK